MSEPTGKREYMGMDPDFGGEVPTYCIDCGAPAFYIDEAGTDGGYYHAVTVEPGTCYSSAMRDDVPDPAHPRYQRWLDGWTWDDVRRDEKYSEEATR